MDAHAVAAADAGARGREAARAARDRGAGSRRAEKRRAAHRRRDVRGALGGRANHAKSTGRLDVEAQWNEPLDDVAQDAPSDLDGYAHVGDFQLPGGRERLPDRQGRHAAGRAAEAPAPARVQGHQAPLRQLPGDRDHPLPRVLPAGDHERPLAVTHDGPEVRLDVPSSAPPGSAARPLRRAHVDVHGPASAASPCRTGSNVSHRRRCGPAPAAACGSTSTARGGPRATTSCSASCSTTSPGSPGRSTSRRGSTCRQWPGPRPRSSRSGRSTSNSWIRRAR